MAEYFNKLPFAADSGNDSIFISYAHKDRELVYPIILGLYENGWPIWYDEGIEPGENWKAALNYRIGSCSLYLLFISNNSLKSINTIDHEFIVAHNFGKPMVICVIEDVDFINDFASINYATASQEKIPRTTPDHLEDELKKIPNLKKGEPRKAQGISLSAPEYKDEGNKRISYDYELCEDGVALTKLHGSSSQIVIPREYPAGSGYPVVELRGTFNHSFDYDSPGKLIISDTVKRIRKGTFYGYAMPGCVSVPPSVEIIESDNFSLDDNSGYEIDPYDRVMNVECAPGYNTDELIRKVMHGMRINFNYDKSLSVNSAETKLFSPKGNYAFVSFSKTRKDEYAKVITSLREKRSNIVSCSEIDESQINRYIRKCGCFIAFEDTDYYASDESEQLYVALAFEKTIAMINSEADQYVSMPDDLFSYICLKQRLRMDDPDMETRLARWLAQKGCGLFN